MVTICICLYLLLALGPVPVPQQQVVNTTERHEANTNYDVFVPIAKYFAAGDAESLSAWFAPSLEVSIFGKANDASKNQAKQIMKAFFQHHSPRAFRIRHQAGRENMKYVLADLTAGGEHFNVIIFATYKSSSSGFQIEQIKIDHLY